VIGLWYIGLWYIGLGCIVELRVINRMLFAIGFWCIVELRMINRVSRLVAIGFRLIVKLRMVNGIGRLMDIVVVMRIGCRHVLRRIGCWYVMLGLRYVLDGCRYVLDGLRIIVELRAVNGISRLMDSDGGIVLVILGVTGLDANDCGILVDSFFTGIVHWRRELLAEVSWPDRCLELRPS